MHEASFSAQIRNLLSQSGLSETEVHVFLSIQKKPAQTIWDLVKRLKISKSSLYRACEKLEEMKMIERNKNGICASGFQHLIYSLEKKQKNYKKITLKLRKLSPYMKTNVDCYEEFKVFYDVDTIRDGYMFMAEHDYQTNLDFGDYEAFVPLIGGYEIGEKFQDKRSAKSKSYSLCTTDGNYTKYFTYRHLSKNRPKANILKVAFTNKLIIFSDTNDYVLFNHFENRDDPYSVLVKSKIIADTQREQLKIFSEMKDKIIHV